MAVRMRVAVIVVIAVAGCSHQRHYPQLSSGTVRVETIDGARIQAKVAPHPTQVVLVDERGREIPTERIARVVDVKRGRGAFEGAMIVGVSAAVVGTAIGFAQGDDPPCANVCILHQTAADKAAFHAIVYGYAGAGVGALIGVVIGSRDVYTFGDEYEARITPSGPPGSIAGATIQF